MLVCLLFKAASQAQPMHNEMDQPELVVRYDDIIEVANNSMGKDSLPKHLQVNKLSPAEHSRSIYLKLNGSEGECMFSSTEPKTKPTINVS